MEERRIIPVILCGGAGARLWPLSRADCPKQFLRLAHAEYSLFQQTILRVADRAIFAAPLIVGHEEHRFIMAEQLRQLGIADAVLLLEPLRCNTAPAIASAAWYLRQRNAHAMMLALPSDHMITDEAAFRVCVQLAANTPQAADRLVLFGVAPERAETGYGYIRANAAKNACLPLRTVAAFVEKPVREEAEALIRQEGYFWNSGIFLLPAGAFLSELVRHAPEVHASTQQAVERAERDGIFLRLHAEYYRAAPALSVDVAVMERTDRACMMPLACGWADAGSWESLWRIDAACAEDNVLRGEAYTRGSRGNYAYSEGPAIALDGVEGLCVVATPDAVLVSRRDSRDADRRALYAKIALASPALVRGHRIVHRPWGCFEILEAGFRHQVKRLTIRPGARLSRQMHHHRSEHWVIVQGTAQVEVNGECRVYSENEAVYVPLGATHQISNPGRIDLQVIEVQSGAYLGEDDVIRFQENTLQHDESMEEQSA